MTTEWDALPNPMRTFMTVDVEQHFEGNFPGGVADLDYRFTLDGALISQLVIEP